MHAGGQGHSAVPTKEVIYQITFEYIAHNVSSSLPSSRYLLLHGAALFPIRFALSMALEMGLPQCGCCGLSGEKGDLSSARGPHGELPRWSIPQGLITFHLADGHAPGQAGPMHRNESSMCSERSSAV